MSLKFRKKIKKQTIDLREGGKVYIRQVLPIELADINEDMSDMEVGLLYLKKAIIGWENIEDEDTGEKLPFNKDNVLEIANALCMDKEYRDKVTTFFTGSTQNLTDGSTASTSMDGLQKDAPNVGTKEKQRAEVVEPVDTQKEKSIQDSSCTMEEES